MAIKVYSGGVAPETLVAIGTAGSSGVDLTTVTAASISVKRPDGTLATWACAILAATISTITVSHDFGAGETSQLGTYGMVLRCTVPAGTVRIRLVPLEVLDEFS